MTTPTTTVEIKFDGTNWIDVSAYVNATNFQRGKTNQIWDDIGPSSGSITLNNETRRFDPLYSSGPYYGDIRPGKRVRIKTQATQTFFGRIADWDLTYDVSGRSIAVARLEDGLALLGRQQFDAWTTTDAQRTDQRLTSILARSEVSWTDGTTFDTGASTLQDNAIAAGTTVLSEMQTVATSELGFLFIGRDGTLTFLGRHYTANAAAAAAFADDGTGLYYHQVATTFGSETLYNRVGVDAPGLTRQTSTATPTDADDGIRALSVSTLLFDETQMADMASYLATTRSSGDVRVSSIVVNLNTSQYTAGNRTTIAGLEIGNLVTVKFRPNSVGSSITQTLQIEGIAHDVSPEAHFVTLYTTGADTTSPFIVDDTTWGVVDGPGLLVF